jgi:short-subunit dehydrogenase
MPLHLEITGVRVVAMCPGFTESSIGPKKNVVLEDEWEKILLALKKEQP